MLQAQTASSGYSSVLIVDKEEMGQVHISNTKRYRKRKLESISASASAPDKTTLPSEPEQQAKKRQCFDATYSLPSVESCKGCSGVITSDLTRVAANSPFCFTCVYQQVTTVTCARCNVKSCTRLVNQQYATIMISERWCIDCTKRLSRSKQS
jgi:hypothetical protein